MRSLPWRVMAHPRIAAFAQSSGLARAIGWGKFNPHYWTHGGYADFVQWWAERMLPEPHSTKQIEDAVAWSHDTDGARLAASAAGAPAAPLTRRAQTELAARVRCPVLVIHGTKDRVTPYADGKALAKITGGKLETVKGAGHLPHARKPVQVNVAMREFFEPTPMRDPTVHRPDGRKRVLYISSPIGLGHAQRDVAIARELRGLVDGLEIDWLAQDPVTRVLEKEGEQHPPGKPAPGQRVAPHRVRIGRARPARLPGHPPDGRDPDQQLHGLPRPRSRAALRPVGGRRGLGARLLPAREPATRRRPAMRG